MYESVCDVMCVLVLEVTERHLKSVFLKSPDARLAAIFTSPKLPLHLLACERVYEVCGVFCADIRKSCPSVPVNHYFPCLRKPAYLAVG